MTGAEIVAASKAIEVAGRKVLGQEEKTTDQLLDVAAGTPEFESAARALAARIAVKERIKLKIYQPFARMLGVSKVYFEDVFPEEMAAKMAAIPAEHTITPPANIAVPALQGLSYSFEDPDLRDLYLNLLATATDDRRTDEAHPAFAEVIKQLTPTEAKLLNWVLVETQVPAAWVKRVIKAHTYETVISHLLPVVDEDSGTPLEFPQMPAWVDNWARLGLVEVTYQHQDTDDPDYSWVIERPEYIRIASREPDVAFEVTRGLVWQTAFGERFHRAVTSPHGRDSDQ
nr:DUF4393 domain-containing protein [Micromonospora provocatoris]